MNCVCSKFREELEKEGGHDVEKRLEKEFPAWFRSHVSGSRFIFNFICVLHYSFHMFQFFTYFVVLLDQDAMKDNREVVSEGLYAISYCPDLRVKIWASCSVNGVRYNTIDGERQRQTQNRGVLVDGSHNGVSIEFYGHLKEIVELSYNSNLEFIRTVVLFWHQYREVLEQVRPIYISNSIKKGLLCARHTVW